jgi:hypothetical protein
MEVPQSPDFAETEGLRWRKILRKLIENKARFSA